MPEAVRQRLVTVRKRQQSADGSWQETEDAIWIPERWEVFGEGALYFGLFADAEENRIKRRGSSPSWWWLRSAYDLGSHGAFYCVSSKGGKYGSFPYDSHGVALGFCL